MSDESPSDINQSATLDSKGAPFPNSLWVAAWAVSLGSIFLLTCYYWLMHPLRLGSDQAVYLAIAEMMLEGKQLYTQIHEVNPPLIVYINFIPALICKTTQITPALALSAFVMSMTLLSLTLCSITVYRNRDEKQSLCLLPMLLSFLLFIKSDTIELGQREQLLCIGYLPFLIVRFLRWHDRKIDLPIAVASGLLAGLGICLKHYFLIIAAVPELVHFLQNRKWRPIIAPEVMAAVAVGLIYAAHFLFLPREVLSTYFGVIVPFVQQGYTYYMVSPMRALDFWRLEFYQMALLIIAAIPVSRCNQMLAPVAAFTIASLAVYLIPGQDWSYHMVPIRAGIYLMTGLLCGSAVLFVRSLLSTRQRRFDTVLAVAVILYFSGWGATGLWRSYFEILDNEDKPVSAFGYDSKVLKTEGADWNRIIDEYSSPGDNILFIARGASPGYPHTIQTGRRAGSRYMHAMTLLMAKYMAWNNDDVVDKKPYQQLLNRIVADYAEDIKNNKPKIIVIQKSEVHEVLIRFHFYEKHMSHYRLAEKFEDFLIYVLKDWPNEQ